MIELDDLSFVLIAIAVFLVTLNIAMWLSSCDTTPSAVAAAKKAAAAKNAKEKYVKQYGYYSQGDVDRCGCQGPQTRPTYGWSEKGMAQSRFNPGVGI